jgi:hypothetical protein
MINAKTVWTPSRQHPHLRHLFAYLPRQPGYNKRLRQAAGLIRSVNRILATITSVWSDRSSRRRALERRP